MDIALFEQPHVEARALLATGAPVYLTVNPTEYHGPHLSLHNDRLVSRGLVRALHEHLAVDTDWPLLFADDLEIGVAPCPGIGSHHARFQTVQALVTESCRAIAELGAQRVVIMTFHGAPLHNVALHAGIELLEARGIPAVAPFHAVLRELAGRDDVSQYADALAPIADAADRAQVLAELPTDYHAGFFETSMAMHLAPASVSESHREVPPCPPVTPDPKVRAMAQIARRLGRDALAREIELAAFGLGWNALRPFPGYTGRPHLASAASGEVFTRYFLDQLVPLVRDVFEGRRETPKPIMRWLAPLTANGRLGEAAGGHAPSQ